VAELRLEAIRRGGRRVLGLGGDLTGQRCRGEWLSVGVSVDADTLNELISDRAGGLGFS